MVNEGHTSTVTLHSCTYVLELLLISPNDSELDVLQKKKKLMIPVIGNWYRLCGTDPLLLAVFLEEFTIEKKDNQEMVSQRDWYNYDAGKEKVSVTQNAGEKEEGSYLQCPVLAGWQHEACCVLQSLLLSLLLSKLLLLARLCPLWDTYL